MIIQPTKFLFKLYITVDKENTNNNPVKIFNAGTYCVFGITWNSKYADITKLIQEVVINWSDKTANNIINPIKNHILKENTDISGKKFSEIGRAHV